MTFTMVLVSTDDDIILCKNFCKKCIQQKLELTVLKSWVIDNKEANQMYKLNKNTNRNNVIRTFNLQCNCNKEIQIESKKRKKKESTRPLNCPCCWTNFNFKGQGISHIHKSHSRKKHKK